MLVFVLAAFYWTKSLLYNVAAFTGMLLYPESTLQLCFSRRFYEVFKEVYFGSLSAVRTTWYSIRTLISQQKLQTVQVYIRPDVMANRPAAIQSSKRSQCSNASVRTSWLYRPDAIQCLTSISVSASRHSYGKTAATVRTICDPVRTMSSIRQVVHSKFNRPDVSLHGLDDPSLIMVIKYSGSATVRTLGQHRPDVALL
jgi:hypothetical protein